MVIHPFTKNITMPYTALIEAIIANNLNTIHQLAAAGADFNSAVELTQAPEDDQVFQVTPIFVACLYGHVDIVRYILSQAVDTDITEDTGCPSTHSPSALHAAVMAGSIEIINLLLAEDEETEFFDHFLYTPLHYAAMIGNLDVIASLLNAGANPDARDDFDGDTPMSLAISSKHLDFNAIYAPLAFNQHFPNHTVALCLAKIDVFLDADVDVNYAYPSGCSLICLATEMKFKEMVQHLLERGAGIGVVMDGGQTLIHTALDYYDPQILFMLVRAFRAAIADNPTHILADANELSGEQHETLQTVLHQLVSAEANANHSFFAPMDIAEDPLDDSDDDSYYGSYDDSDDDLTP